MSWQDLMNVRLASRHFYKISSHRGRYVHHICPESEFVTGLKCITYSDFLKTPGLVTPIIQLCLTTDFNISVGSVRRKMFELIYTKLRLDGTFTIAMIKALLHNKVEKVEFHGDLVYGEHESVNDLYEFIAQKRNLRFLMFKNRDLLCFAPSGIQNWSDAGWAIADRLSQYPPRKNIAISEAENELKCVQLIFKHLD
uniref:FBD domain-containing protein n=1 Tax=Panagrellus redivivus TaxID=6233 RepID=A0A7E4VKH9_PANRE